MLITLIGRIESAAGVFHSKDKLASILSQISFSVYVLLIMAAGFITLIYLLIRFYKSMFTDEGYLTFTLPVKPATLLNGKVLVAFCWMILDMVLVCLSIFILAVSPKTFAELQKGMLEISGELAKVGLSISELVIWVVIFVIVGAFSCILAITASLSLGQLSNKHKIAMSVVSYIGMSILTQVVSTYILSMSSFNSFLENIEKTGFSLPAFHQFMYFSLFVSILFTVMYYLITYFIISKKLNLE